MASFSRIGVVIVTLFGFSASLVSAQELSISGFNVSERGQVEFGVYIASSHSDRERYDLIIYSSADDFRDPLDLSITNLAPGEVYPIEFDANQLVGSFEGELRFRIDIKASVFPIKADLKEKPSFRRGKEIDISWTDYHNSGPYDVELRRGDDVIEMAKNVSANEITTALPKDMEKADDYILQIKTANNTRYDSDPIPVQIKNKIPLGILLSGAAVGVGVPIFFIAGGNEPPTDEGFADPPGEPNN